jgi:acyl-coenzyme A synthetase/AMP-(fatty) acid ligase
LAAPPERLFFTMWEDDDDIQTVTFGEFTRFATAQAAELDAHGLKCKDTVVLVMPQGIPLLATFAGAVMLDVQSRHVVDGIESELSGCSI